MRRPRLWPVLAAALAGLLVTPAGALAHATLEGTQPERGVTVARDPGQVVFRFDQTVEGNFGAVRVFDATGRRVDQGDAFHPGGTGSLIGAHLRPALANGTYTATYRVVSSDGHIVSGGFVFAVGVPGTAPGLTVAQLLGKNSTGAATQIAFGAARALQFGSIAVGVGAIFFLLIVWLPALQATAGGASAWRAASTAFITRLRTIALTAALVGAVSALAGVTLEAAEAAGVSGWSALRPHILQQEFTTRFGTIWTAAAACWLATGVLVAGLVRPSGSSAFVLKPVSLGSTGLALGAERRLVTVALAVPLLGLLLLPAWSGHGSTQSPVGVMFPSITVHVGALALWFGGLVTLLVALPAATRRLDAPERSRLLAGVLSRFSTVAFWSVVALLATGVAQSIVEVRHFDLLLSTAFGRAVLIKAGLLTCLIGLGALNRQRTVPRLRRIAADGGTPGQTGITLRRTLRTEVVLIVAALGVAGALASYAPSNSVYSGPVSGTATLAGKQVQYTLDPARVGSNQLHLYLIDPKTGAQWDGAQQLTVSESLPDKAIGPLQQTGQKSGPGHYTVPGVVLGVPGTWRLQISVLIDKFDQASTTLSVPVH